MRDKDAKVALDEKLLVLTLPVNQPPGKSQNASISLKLIDSSNEVRASSIVTVALKPSQHEITAAIADPLHDIAESEEDLYWFRLSYEIRSDSSQVLASGIIPVSTADSDFFRLAVVSARYARVGRTYEVEVNAVNPVTHRPVPQVQINGVLGWGGDTSDDAKSKQTLRARTDVAGNARLSFELPANATNTAGIVVTGSKGVLSRKVEKEVRLSPAKLILLDSDKPIYQPGQTVHLRSLLLNSQHKVLSGQELTVVIKDEDQTQLLHQQVVTDSFGVAHTDWTIPSNARFGSYSIQVQTSVDDEDSPWDRTFFHSVQVYRYDLPNFAVTAKSERPYYLHGQNALIKVTANYLFGKPVKRAKVRVAEEKDRYWNYRQQKWVVNEGQTLTGELNENGEFTATLDLSSHYDDLEDNDYSRFRDVKLGAYVTDLSTGRTEQGYFEVRVTREPIHVYLLQEGQFSENIADDAFISAFYADGTPCRCTVQISSFDEKSPATTRIPLQAVRTSKYGLGKIHGILPFKTKSYQGKLLLEALDAKGLAGKMIGNVETSDDARIRVITSHAIYKSGEALEISLEATQPNLRLLVNVLHDGELLGSRRVTLRNSHAFTVFPYDPRFSGQIDIVALDLSTMNNRYDDIYGHRSVLFPKPRQLALQVHFDKNSYRPGEPGSAQLAVKMPDGTAAPSELGVKIVDEAVEQRARTDQRLAYSTLEWSYWGLWGRGGSFAGISRQELDNLDLSQNVPQDLDMVAEYLLNGSGEWDSPEVELSNEARDPEDAFAPIFRQQFQKLQDMVRAEVAAGRVITTLDDLGAVGREYSIDVLRLHDPWGTSYHFSFSYAGKERNVAIHSAGPDKNFATKDDFTAYTLRWEYFQHTGKLIDKACQDFFLRTGRFVRDTKTLKTELLAGGIDLDTLRDPWGNLYTYHFEVDRSFAIVKVASHGPNSEPKDSKHTNDIEVWRNATDYFSAVRARLDITLNKYLNAGGAFPKTEADFKAVLRQSGIEFDSMQDPWDNPYRVVFRSFAAYSQRLIMISQVGGVQRTSTPVTMLNQEISVVSPGLDKTPGTDDDFEVAHYSALISEQKESDIGPQPATGTPAFNGNTGAIRGVVLDESGAVIVGAKVTAVAEGSEIAHKETTDTYGKFVLLDLSPGLYTVNIEASGFNRSRVLAVPVQAITLTEVNVVLRVGTAAQTVEVTASAAPMQTQSSETASSVIKSVPILAKTTVSTNAMTSTPRLRQYFPETMLWEPALETNRAGQVKLHFKLADNITTWRMTAVASTKTGELGVVDKNLRSFQPFFVEHDPPRILTEGDEISYPVVLRNYLDKVQSVQATIKPESWFKLLSPVEQKVRIEAGDAGHATFRYRAIASVDDGKQRITAANTEISDAIEKPLDVHPFGRQDSQTDGALFDNTATLHVQVPENAIPGSLRGELKIYPSLMAHVVESVEAVLERPYGCGEQTISSTYPSLLVVRYYKQQGGAPPLIATRAQRYLQAGYERLLRYQDSTGGFTYWGRGDPNVALTAYALAFLNDAAQLIEVDHTVMETAEKWLTDQQLKDGGWLAVWAHNESSILQTAYVARILAELPPQKEVQEKRGQILKKALQFLAANRGRADEPYVIASFAIAAQATGDQPTADSLLETLRNTSYREGESAYWDLQTNTPFYSWGRTGRLESTALVARALHHASQKAATDQDLVRRAVLFLMRNQDRYGIWHSGQTTLNVLQTLMDLLAGNQQLTSTKLHIMVNGKEAGDLVLPAGNESSALLRRDLTPYVKPGDNQVELKADDKTSLITAQEVINFYTPWPDPKAALPTKPEAGALKLTVNYSKTTAKENDTIECHVKAERVGFRGYGMMLAEIGLPPGVDVDRESLEQAMINSHWSLNHYDVMPDHVVVYLWPNAGGTELTFKFRLRFAMEAETAPSLIYDYYNPDAVVTIKPVKFSIQENVAQAH